MRLSTCIILVVIAVAIGACLVGAGQEIKSRDTARQERIAELCKD